MATINRKHIHIIVFFLLAILVPQTTMAQKRKTKKEEQTSHTDWVPDKVSRKAMPDRRPSSLEKPILTGNRNNSTTQVHGIDVSHHQGRIDWDEVAKDSKVGYVYLKATEGTGFVDNTYKYNFQACKRVGLKVGSYLFFRPNQSAKGQFDLFVSTVDTKKQDLLPFIDVEVVNGVSASVLQTRLLELCDLFEREYGKKPIIYTGRIFYQKYLYGNPRLRTYKYFIAAYSPSEPPALHDGLEYPMWQYSSTGRVRGIRGNVDMSRLVGRTTMRDIMY